MHARRTTAVHVAALVALGLLLGSIVRPLTLRLGGTPPRPGWLVGVLLLALAILAGVLAWSTWQSLHQRKQRMTSQHAMTLLALAKACGIVGALSFGAYGGFALAFVRDWDTVFGRDRVLQGGSAAVAGLLLLVSALLLERALHVPQPDEEDDDAPPGAATAA
jgi:nitrate/nitrite transporter NarK